MSPPDQVDLADRGRVLVVPSSNPHRCGISTATIIQGAEVLTPCAFRAMKPPS
jgi:hypothetical protein